KLKAHYFSGDESLYLEDQFRRRFRMSPTLFYRLMNACIEEDPEFFRNKTVLTGKAGHDSFQKCTAALKDSGSRVPADSVDEYLQISEGQSRLAFYHFCRAIVSKFEGQYLSGPSPARLRRSLDINALRGFPGMVGSIDCMHWQWKNCPVAYQAQYKGKEGKPTVVLEAAAGPDLYFYHCFFGAPGTWNDINVLNSSTFMQKLVEGVFSPAGESDFELNGLRFSIPYFLADGIYPKWACFLKTKANGLKFSKWQEAIRKDVERAFGVLQNRFTILGRACQLHSVEDMELVVKTCMIIHNMLVE
ncbi:unnamed protein product, partial [Heterosigma akashiwo]